MSYVSWTTLASVCLTWACTLEATPGQTPDAASPDAQGILDRPDAGALPPRPMPRYVFAHSAYDLHRVDPSTLSHEHVGSFEWPDSDVPSHDTIGDLAVDADGNLVGVSVRLGRIYSIDPATARATLIAELEDERTYNGLSFVPAASGDGEVLLGTTRDGAIYHIDLETGSALSIGSLREGLGFSGDIVYVEGAGMFATVDTDTDTDGDRDHLALVDRWTFEAELIGPIGADRVWGLGFWAGRLYGFTSEGPRIDDGGRLLEIDPLSGVGSPVGDDVESPWWGAAVSTRAPAR